MWLLIPRLPALKPRRHRLRHRARLAPAPTPAPPRSLVRALRFSALAPTHPTPALPPSSMSALRVQAPLLIRPAPTLLSILCRILKAISSAVSLLRSPFLSLRLVSQFSFFTVATDATPNSVAALQKSSQLEPHNLLLPHMK